MERIYSIHNPFRRRWKSCAPAPTVTSLQRHRVKAVCSRVLAVAYIRESRYPFHLSYTPRETTRRIRVPRTTRQCSYAHSELFWTTVANYFFYYSQGGIRDFVTRRSGDSFSSTYVIQTQRLVVRHSVYCGSA